MEKLKNKKEIIHVYLMPGMAASSKIFEYIKLPEEIFELHYLDWIAPLKNEKISDYAFRMAKGIKHDQVILIGVSFGGLIVQEIDKFISVRKIVIISSIKCVSELPKKMKFAKFTLAYKLLPVKLVGNINLLAKYAFGKAIKKRVELYKKYISLIDSDYLIWAIRNMVSWKQTQYRSDIIHIHGDLDTVFPIKNITNCIVIKGGTHIMIINKHKWFNENLPSLLV